MRWRRSRRWLSCASAASRCQPRGQPLTTAVARSALREAAEHFATALRLLDTLPDAPGRARQALDVQILYGQALAATKGYGAGEVIEAFDRARELAQQAGATPELRAVLFGLWASIAGKGELRVADELADELLGMGERSGVRGELVCRVTAPVKVDEPPNAEPLEPRESAAGTRVRAHEDRARRIDPRTRIRQQSEASQRVAQLQIQ